LVPEVDTAVDDGRRGGPLWVGKVPDRHLGTIIEWLRRAPRLDGEDIGIVRVMKERSWRS